MSQTISLFSERPLKTDSKLPINHSKNPKFSKNSNKLETTQKHLHRVLTIPTFWTNASGERRQRKWSAGAGRVQTRKSPFKIIEHSPTMRRILNVLWLREEDAQLTVQKLTAHKHVQTKKVDVIYYP